MPFISLHDPLWSELLGQTECGCYCLPGYAQLDAELVGGNAIAWLQVSDENVFLIPLIERVINNTSGLKDLVSPYGFPGVLFKHPVNDFAALKLFQSFSQEAHDAGFVSSFIRLNPFSNNWNLELNGSNDQIKIAKGTIVSIDLSGDYQTIIRSISSNHQRNIRNGNSLGLIADINRWEYYSDFVNIYYQTMERLKADTYYFFPQDYFRRIKSIFQNNLIISTVHDPNGRLCSGGLFIIDGKIMHYHLGCTCNESIQFSPSKLIIAIAIEYAKGNGIRLLNLGGGLGASESDGLFRFKKGFGKIYNEYCTVRIIHDPKVYESLIMQGTGRKFFPSYRMNAYDNN